MDNNTDPFVYRVGEKNISVTSTGNPLDGLRLAVKDLFHIAGLPTTAGNPDWLKSHDIPQQSSSIVTKLLANGAHFTGKTLTDELAYSLNGQNLHYGTPINAKAPDRLPGGSSSGSAVAVATGEADIGLGTDTGGSIRVPASYNGLYGLRPTHGVIATDNMVPLAPGFDTVGWFTRDLKTMKSVAKTLLPQRDIQVSTTLGVLSDVVRTVAHGSAIQEFITTANYPDITNTKFDIALLSEASDAFRVLQGRQIWQQHGQWFTATNPFMAPDIYKRFAWCSTLSEEQELEARATAARVNETLQTVMANNQVLIMPTTPGPAPLLSTTEDDLVHYRNYLLGLTALAGLGGLPQLHIPIETKGEPPVGLSLLGPKDSDLDLIELAQQLTGETA